MTKILIGAGDLRDLIAKHPHIEVGLLKSVVPQIAEMIRKQAISREPAIKQMVDETFQQAMLAVGSRHGITDAMKGVIRIYLAEVWNEQAKEIANETARAAATEIVRDAIASELKVVREQIVLDDKKARGQIDAYAKEAAEREVLALLRAGNLTIKS